MRYKVDQIDEKTIKEFYESVDDVWPSNDMWHTYSRNQIEKYLKKIPFPQNSNILNAGSGGNDYGLKVKMYHVDIAKNKIEHLIHASVASIEDLPFDDKLFDDVICVGSVLNYCDAMAAIFELSRVLKNSGHLVLEFESSWGFEHLGTSAYKKPAEIVTLKYYMQPHRQWVYSLKYIHKILEANNFKICSIYRFHILSGLHYNKHHDENAATPLTKFDRIFRHIPYFSRHSNNIILLCKKL